MNATRIEDLEVNPQPYGSPIEPDDMLQLRSATHSVIKVSVVDNVGHRDGDIAVEGGMVGPDFIGEVDSSRVLSSNCET